MSIRSVWAAFREWRREPKRTAIERLQGGDVDIVALAREAKK